jgi:negative regulator of sigma E activity
MPGSNATISRACASNETARSQWQRTALIGAVLSLAGAPGWSATDVASSAVLEEPTPAAIPNASSENKDLELIPQGLREAPSSPTSTAPAAATAAQRLYLENAFTTQSRRGAGLVPLPPPPPFDWQERIFLDVRKQWDIGDGVSASYSGRLNLRAENDIDFPNRQNVLNDLREAYASWQPLSRSYLDLGRINLKSGIALGYNPTDYFKTRAVVEPLSADPTVLREDRLGTLMMRGLQVWDRGSLTVAFAPHLYSPSAIYAGLNLPSFDPSLDRTNAANRLLLKGTANVSANLSPELLYYREGGQSRVGANLTQNIGQRSIAYLEWSGGTRPDLIEQALLYGRETGTLPASAPAVLPENPRRRFQSELALGASYAGTAKVTVNLEYHFNQAAFTAADWSRWFTIGRGTTAASLVAAELWYVRDYAADQQQPINRHSLFLRADCTDAFVRKLELSGFIDVDLHDGSSLLQFGADYYLSDHWTVGGLLIGYAGARRSDFGSLPIGATFLVDFARYL